MARTDPTRPRAPAPRPEPATASQVWTFLFFLVSGCVGIGMLVLVGAQFAQVAAGLALGSGSVPELLALHGPRAEVAGPVGTAADALSQLFSLAVLTCASGAALMLVLGAALGLQPNRRGSAHRIATTGLWMALVVALTAMLPIQGYPFTVDGGMVDGPPGGPQWHPGLKLLAVVAGAGLLLSAITAHPHRLPHRPRSVRHR